MKDEHEHHHHHDEDEHDEHHHHHHHDEDDHDEDEHEHHHHHHDHDEDEHDHDEHEHHHDHDENCTCGCHDHHDHGEHHHDHHHHHADDIFASWGFETPTAYSQAEIENILSELENEEKYGQILRAKGMVPAGDGTWINFDYVPGESDIRKGSAEVTGKICVIGAELKEDNLKTLFEK
jgi:hypothetical protein